MNNILILKLIIFLTIATYGCAESSSTKFYISNNGSDKNSGISPDSPWKTISKVNSMHFKPGDSILFERGSTWRISDDNTLNINQSGIKNNYIFYGAYGEGNKPRFLGSNEVIGWTKVKNNIWKAELNYNPRKISYGGELFFRCNDNSTKWGFNLPFKEDFFNLKEDLDWTWNNNTVYVFSEISPDKRFSEVEAPKARRLVLLNDKEYIKIDNIELAYCILIGIYDNYAPQDVKGLSITNCHIHHIGHKDSGQGFGLSVRHSEMYIAHNNIHDCGRRNISLVTYNNSPTISVSNVVIEHNYLHDGWHTTGVDINTLGSHSVDSVIIRNNLFYEPDSTDLSKKIPNKSLTSNTIFISQQGSGKIGNIYIYNNIFNGHHGSGILMENAENIYIYYNTFYKFNPTLKGYYAFVSSSRNVKNVKILNNIFYDNGITATERDLFCISFRDTLKSSTFSDFNLFYEQDPTNRTIMLQNHGGERLYYYYKIFEMERYSNFHNRDKNSVFGKDPLFIDSGKGNLRLQSNSPAIDSAKPINWITKDYYGNTRNLKTPTIGAIENISAPLTD